MPAARKTDFDVVIVGAGPAGLFAAHHLCEHSDLRVLVVDKGKGPLKRRCRINDYRECFKCKPCDILSGVGGAGLFSDGKLNFIYKLGKTDLSQFMPVPEAERLIAETETVFKRFGMDGPVYPTIFNNLKFIYLSEEDEYASFQTDLAVYHDDYADYSTNECTMDGTACLVYYLSALQNANPAE